MITKADIDQGHAFHWGKTAQDYAVYRPGYPESFYTILHALGIGRPGQAILDLGTGTGVLARAFAQCGASVIGLDLAAEQIVVAQQLARQEHLDIQFVTCAAEEAERMSLSTVNLMSLPHPAPNAAPAAGKKLIASKAGTRFLRENEKGGHP